MLFQKLKFQSQKEILNPRVYFQSLTFQSQFGPLNFSQEYSGKKKLAASALLTLEGYTGYLTLKCPKVNGSEG